MTGEMRGAGAVLAEMREQGWSVAVHNDYRQDGQSMTFWLLTHPRAGNARGEGRSDAEALEQAHARAEEALERADALHALEESAAAFLQSVPQKLMPAFVGDPKASDTWMLGRLLKYFAGKVGPLTASAERAEPDHEAAGAGGALGGQAFVKEVVLLKGAAVALIRSLPRHLKPADADERISGGKAEDVTFALERVKVRVEAEWQKGPGEPEPTAKALWCTHCGRPHVDDGEWATRVHREHVCTHCGGRWRVEPPVFGAARSTAPSAGYALVREMGVGGAILYFVGAGASPDRSGFALHSPIRPAVRYETVEEAERDRQAHEFWSASVVAYPSDAWPADVQQILADLSAARQRAEALQAELGKERERSGEIEHQFTLYRKAWRRELGPHYREKTFEVDALVVSTQGLRERAERGEAGVAAELAELRVLKQARENDRRNLLEAQAAVSGAAQRAVVSVEKMVEAGRLRVEAGVPLEVVRQDVREAVLTRAAP